MENKDDFNDAYDSRLRTIKLVDKKDGQIINIPVCYAKAETHTRKPVPRNQLEEKMLNTIECAGCPVFTSCMELTKVDLLDQQLMFLRDLVVKNGFTKSSK